MRRLSILLLVVVSAVASALAVVPATPAAAAVCKPFMVIGLRGSGQSVTAGPYQMGGVVDRFVETAFPYLPNDQRSAYGLSYPATSPINPSAYFASVDQGRVMLLNDIRGLIANCPNVHIGLIGYSQGAHVIHEALDRMSVAERGKVRAVLLLADPFDAGAGMSYSVHPGPFDQPAPHLGSGIFDSRPLPADIHNRSMAICLRDDPVCDDFTLGGIFSFINYAAWSRIHGMYADCCERTRQLAGMAFAFRLLDPPLAAPPSPPGPPGPPPPGPPPPPPTLISTVHGLADGAVVQTVDTGRIYRIVGGAPVWLSSCAGGICPNPLLATQATVDAGPVVPRDGATAQDEAGNVFKFVGGAPVHLSSCAVGCDSPVRITGWSVATLDHMRAMAADGATARDEAGNIFKFVGGAPIHLSSCAVGCGNPVPVNGWSVAFLEHMRAWPADGATAKDEAGNVFKFVGGAPIHLSSCDVGCGNPVPITAWSVATLEHMRPHPVNGATARDEAGNVFKFVGGAPVHMANCAMGCGSPVPITAWSVANLDHMRAIPEDGTAVQTETGKVYKFAGGAPLPLTDCGGPCAVSVGISQWSIDTREHMHQIPVDGTLLVVEDGRQFQLTEGIAMAVGSCLTGPECGIAVNRASLEDLVDAPPGGQDWADFDGDGRADYCRRVGAIDDQRVACTVATATGFGATYVSAKLDWGQPSGRSFVDITGDGKADFCRVRGTANHSNALVSCSPSTGTGFGGDVNSIGALDWGWPTGRGWADANDDGRADYCRRVGGSNHESSYVACTLSRGGDFTTTIVSGVTDWGYQE